MISDRCWAHFAPSFCGAWFAWGEDTKALQIPINDEIGFYCAGGEL